MQLDKKKNILKKCSNLSLNVHFLFCYEKATGKATGQPKFLKISAKIIFPPQKKKSVLKCFSWATAFLLYIL